MWHCVHLGMELQQETAQAEVHEWYDITPNEWFHEGI